MRSVRSIKNNLVGRIPQNFFTVTAVERQREVCRHFGAHNTDSANTGFASGKNIIIAVAVVELTLAIKDVERLIVLRFFLVLWIAVVNRLHVFDSKCITDNFAAFVEFVPLVAFRPRSTRNKNNLVAAFLMHIDERARRGFLNRLRVGTFGSKIPKSLIFEVVIGIR